MGYQRKKRWDTISWTIGLVNPSVFWAKIKLSRSTLNEWGIMCTGNPKEIRRYGRDILVWITEE